MNLFHSVDQNPRRLEVIIASLILSLPMPAAESSFWNTNLIVLLFCLKIFGGEGDFGDDRNIGSHDCGGDYISKFNKLS